MLFVIYSPDVHVQVFLAQTETEEHAWKLYLEQEWNYQEQPNGTYHGKINTHENMQEALETYGVSRQPDGSYSSDEERFASLQEAQAAYGIQENEGMVTSHDKSYPNLAAALSAVPWQAHRLEIAPVTIDLQAPFQVLFTSQDEWEYVELSPEEDVKADIVAELRWLACRYERLNLMPEAVAELKQGVRVAVCTRDKVYFHQEIARLLTKMDKLPAAARQYEHALKFNMMGSNPSQMHFQAAGIYLRLNRKAEVLRHYKQIALEDLDDQEAAEVKQHIAELQQPLNNPNIL